MKNTVTVGREKLEAYVGQVVSGLGLSAEHSTAVAKRLVKAHLRGFDTHGLPVFLATLKHWKRGV